MHEASDFTPAESSLTGEDPPAGIPATGSKALKFVQADDFTDVARLISGTYIHALLIPHVACWISEVSALKAGEIINKYMLSENTRKLEEAEQQRIELEQRRLQAET